MRPVLAIFSAVFLASCATYQPVPDGYTGSTALVRDSGKYIDDWKKAEVFAITEIDGKKIKDTFQASHGASFGQGFNLNLEVTKRPVPARPMQVKIRGSHITGAPIQEIASRAAGTFFSVEGVVAFDPKPDMRYIVKGILQKNGSSVWIEEESSGQVVTDKVVEN